MKGSGHWQELCSNALWVVRVVRQEKELLIFAINKTQGEFSEIWLQSPGFKLGHWVSLGKYPREDLGCSLKECANLPLTHLRIHSKVVGHRFAPKSLATKGSLVELAWQGDSGQLTLWAILLLSNSRLLKL